MKKELIYLILFISGLLINYLVRPDSPELEVFTSALIISLLCLSVVVYIKNRKVLCYEKVFLFSSVVAVFIAVSRSSS